MPLTPELDLAISERGRRKVERMKKDLQIGDGQWRTFNRSLGRRIRRQRIDAVKRQENIDGSRYEKRTSKHLEKESQRNRPMFRKILRKSKVYAEPGFFRIYFPNRKTGGIANIHQKGGVIPLNNPVSGRQLQEIKGEPRYEDPASRKQAKRLRELGYKRSVRVGEKKSRVVRKFPGVKWITENMSWAHAGVVISAMEHYRAGGKDNYYKMPKRELLGLTRSDINETLNTVADEFIERQRNKE